MICFSCVLRDLGFSVVFFFFFFFLPIAVVTMIWVVKCFSVVFLFLFIAVVTMAPPYRKLTEHVDHTLLRAVSVISINTLATMHLTGK